MSEEHKVRSGDHLSRVAATHGFRSFAPLWNEPANLELRKKRVNPHILAVGDVVTIPELNVREVDRGVDQKHRFNAEIHPLVVRLELKHWDGTADDEAPKSTLLDGKPVDVKGTGPGGHEIPVDQTTDRIRVELKSRVIAARVGFIEPADTVAGARERLNNLGYFAGNSDDPTALDFRSAVEEFQCDHALQVDGKVGNNTRLALIKAHGC